MNLGEAFRSAHDGLSAHKMRSGLTMLGIMFGVGAVIAMLAIGAGAARQAQSFIDRMGLRNILVRAKQLRPDELQAIRKKSLGVSLRDAEAVREAVPGVELVAPRVKIDPWKVQAGESRTDATVYGVSHRHTELVALPLSEGRFIDGLDEKEHAQVCVVGASVRRALFAYGPALGRRVKVNDLWCEVVGVVAETGAASSAADAASAGSPAREIYLPVTTAARKLEHEPLASPLDEILVRLSPSVSSRESAAVVKTLLDGLHGGADDYEIVVPEALLEQSRQTQRLFNIVMGCIAGISLLVGGIGIMNIMLASVLERTREIGVRRAIGADKGDICLQFLVESFSISALGGLAGVAIGVGIAQSVSFYAKWPTVVTVASIALAITVSLAVGVLSGLYPALRATKVQPIQALRYE
ncbi:MAG TPA: ABC transporter permease [Polyangia bacterium]|nr:ABC transporter permease [Polyangia bacterium]